MVVTEGRLLGLGRSEAPLRARDLAWLGTIVFFGGILGPALLMWGLTLSPPSTRALLLSTGRLATMAIAWVVFRENVDRRIFLGAMAILAGALVLFRPEAAGARPPPHSGSVPVVPPFVAFGGGKKTPPTTHRPPPPPLATIQRFAARPG